MSTAQLQGSHNLPPDVNSGLLLVRVVSSTYAVAIAFFIARIITRFRPFRLWWDDYILCFAVTVATAGYAALVVSVEHGDGRHIFYLKPEEAEFVGKVGFTEGYLWLWTTTLVRVSMVLTLHRIELNNLWQWGLRVTGGLQLVCAVLSTSINLIECRPIQANWDPFIPGAKCWKPIRFQALLYTMSSIYIASDLILSLFPLRFIRSIRRPLIEKIVLAFLMSLGIFAAAAALVKITKFKYIAVRKDPTYDLTGVVICAWLEAHIGIFAVCVPSLSGPFQRALRRLGLSKMTQNQTDGTKNVSSAADSTGKPTLGMNSFTKTATHSERTAVTDEEASLYKEGNKTMELGVLTTSGKEYDASMSESV